MEGIMTSKEFGEMDPKDKGAKKAPKSVKSEPKRKIMYKFPVPVEGKSSAVLRVILNGKEEIVPIVMQDGIFTFPEKLSNDEKVAYANALTKEKFFPVVDQEYQDSTQVVNGRYVFRACHPDHTEQNPINGNIEVCVDKDKEGEELPVHMHRVYKVTMVNGIAETQEEMVFLTLVNMGFMPGTKKKKGEFEGIGTGTIVEK